MSAEAALRWSGPVVVCCILVAALVAARPAHAEPSADAPSVFGASTTFSWEGHKKGLIRLRREAVLDVSVKSWRDEGPNPAIRVTGAGRFVGIVLARVGADEPSLVAGRFSLCAGGECARPRHVNFVSADTGTGDTATLGPGVYAVYGVADRRGAVRLELGGQTGVRRMHLGQTAAVSAPRLEAHRYGTAAASLFTTGATYSAGESGFSLGMVGFTSKDGRVGRVGDCLYDGEPPGLPQAAYGPQCVALAKARGTGGTELRVVDPSGPMFAMFFLRPFSSGWSSQRGYGLWAASPVGAQRVVSHAFFLTF